MTPKLKEPEDNDLDKTAATDASSLKDQPDGKDVHGQNRRKQNRVHQWIEIAVGSLYNSPIS